MGGLEQFDQVAGGVGEQDLAPTGAGDHVAAEGQAGVTEPGDLGIQVVDDQVDAVVASGGIVGGRAGAGAGGSGQQQPQRAADHVGEGGCCCPDPPAPAPARPPTMPPLATTAST